MDELKRIVKPVPFTCPVESGRPIHTSMNAGLVAAVRRRSTSCRRLCVQWPYQCRNPGRGAGLGGPSSTGIRK